MSSVETGFGSPFSDQSNDDDEYLQSFLEQEDPIPSHFYPLVEFYIVLVLIFQFGVIGSFLLPENGLTRPALFLGGLGLIAHAPQRLVAKAKINLPYLLFSAWLIFSFAWNENPAEWRRAVVRAALLPLVTVIVMGFLPFDRLITLIKNFTIGVIVVIFLLTAAMPKEMTYHLDNETGERTIPGWHGTFDHKNGMMSFLIFGLVTFLVFETNKFKRRAVILAVLALAVLGQSGTGTATLVVVSIATFSLRIRQEASSERSGLIFVVSTITWVTMALTVGLVGPLAVNFFGKDLTFTGRTLIWEASWNVIKKQPWTGYGLGGVWTNQTLQPTADLNRAIGFRVGHSHNGFLELLIQVGAIGLTLYLIMMAVIMTRLWRARYRSPLTARWGIIICLTLFLVSLSEAMTLHPGYLTLVAFLCVVPLDRDPSFKTELSPIIE